MLYKKRGEPSKESATGNAWIYPYPSDAEKAISAFSGKAGLLDQVVCRGRLSLFCPPLAEVVIGDGEADVLGELGSTSRIPEISEDGANWLLFGDSVADWIIRGALEHAKVVRIVWNKEKYDD